MSYHLILGGGNITCKKEVVHCDMCWLQVDPKWSLHLIAGYASTVWTTSDDSEFVSFASWRNFPVSASCVCKGTEAIQWFGHLQFLYECLCHKIGSSMLGRYLDILIHFVRSQFWYFTLLLRSQSYVDLSMQQYALSGPQGMTSTHGDKNIRTTEKKRAYKIDFVRREIKILHHWILIWHVLMKCCLDFLFAKVLTLHTYLENTYL